MSLRGLLLAVLTVTLFSFNRQADVPAWWAAIQVAASLNLAWALTLAGSAASVRVRARLAGPARAVIISSEPGGLEKGESS